MFSNIPKCIICGSVAEDVHHISGQSLSDKAGFIGHFHQDHKHNLVPLCKEHHRLIHDGKVKVSGFVMTSKGLQLEYEEILKSSKTPTCKDDELEINMVDKEENQASSLKDWDF